MENSKLYILIKIGPEKKDVKSYFDLSRAELIIAGKDIKCHKYNEYNSITYNCTTCEIKNLYYGPFTKGIFSTEDFYIKNDRNEINIAHNMKFILGVKSNENDGEYEGIVGMHLPYYDSYQEYNLIVSLKNENVIKSYNWFLNFGNEPKMIIDGYPHEIKNKIFDSKKFLHTNTLSNGN